MSQELVDTLRQARSLAEAIGHTESQYTLVTALKAVLHPGGFASIKDEINFLADEGAIGRANYQYDEHDKEPEFNEKLAHAAKLADELGLPKVKALVEDAGKIHTRLARLAQDGSPDIVEKMLQEDKAPMQIVTERHKKPGR